MAAKTGSSIRRASPLDGQKTKLRSVTDKRPPKVRVSFKGEWPVINGVEFAPDTVGISYEEVWRYISDDDQHRIRRFLHDRGRTTDIKENGDGPTRCDRFNVPLKKGGAAQWSWAPGEVQFYIDDERIRFGECVHVHVNTANEEQGVEMLKQWLEDLVHFGIDPDNALYDE